MAAPASVILPHSRCGSDFAHGGHSWPSAPPGRATWWCEGLPPATVTQAWAGAARLGGLADADRFVDVCRKTPAGRDFLRTDEWQELWAAIEAGGRRPLAVRLFTPWNWVVDKTGLRFVSGDPKFGSWWRYVLTEPADAAYSLPRLAACRWLGRHGRVCDGKRDAVHLAWRRERLVARREDLEARRRQA